MFRMRVQTIRSMLWLGNLVVAAGVGVALVNIVQQHRKGTLTDWLAPQEIEKRLSVPGTIQALDNKNDLAEWPEYGALWKLNVTGKEPPAPVEVAKTNTETVVQPMKPIEDVLEVVFAFANSTDGLASIHYLEDGDRSLPALPQVGPRGTGGIRSAGTAASEPVNPKDRSLARVQDTFIRVGDELRAPYNQAPFFGKVVGIAGDGVHFQWGPEVEVLETPKMEQAAVGGLGLMGGIGPDGKPIPGEQLEAKKPEAPKQRESYRINEDAWFIGADEVERIQADSEALIAEIGVKNKYVPDAEGKGRIRLVIDAVPEGSLAYQRGFREGDVLRTVNGELIQSKASVVSYFERNPTAKSFTIEIERLGAVVRKSFTVAR